MWQRGGGIAAGQRACHVRRLPSVIVNSCAGSKAAAAGTDYCIAARQPVEVARLRDNNGGKFLARLWFKRLQRDRPEIYFLGFCLAT